jgi:hypothetical protein
MGRAILFPIAPGAGTEEGGAKKTDLAVSKDLQTGFSREALRQARIVLAYSPKLAGDVRDDGAPPTNARTRSIKLDDDDREQKNPLPRPKQGEITSRNPGLTGVIQGLAMGRVQSKSLPPRP